MEIETEAKSDAAKLQLGLRISEAGRGRGSTLKDIRERAEHRSTLDSGLLVSNMRKGIHSIQEKKSCFKHPVSGVLLY